MNNQSVVASEPHTHVFFDTDTVALLTFTVGGQLYSFAVSSVVRIIEMVTITHLPDVPDFVQGIINLQGKAVPVIDLRRRFNLPLQAYGLHTPIILVNLGGDGRMLGLIVDTVEDVLNVPRLSLEITEGFVPSDTAGPLAIRTAYIAGVAKVNRQMIIVLDTHALLAAPEQAQVSEALENQH